MVSEGYVGGERSICATLGDRSRPGRSADAAFAAEEDEATTRGWGKGSVQIVCGGVCVVIVVVFVVLLAECVVLLRFVVAVPWTSVTATGGDGVPRRLTRGV